MDAKYSLMNATNNSNITKCSQKLNIYKHKNFLQTLDIFIMIIQLIDLSLHVAIVVTLKYNESNQTTPLYLCIVCIVSTQLIYCFTFMSRTSAGGYHEPFRTVILRRTIILLCCILTSPFLSILMYLTQQELPKIGGKIHHFFYSHGMNIRLRPYMTWEWRIGFIIESLFESLPMCLIQLTAMSGSHNYINLCSILVSFISISSTSLVAAYDNAARALTINYCLFSVLLDVLLLFLTASWGFWRWDYAWINDDSMDKNHKYLSRVWVWRVIVMNGTLVIFCIFGLASKLRRESPRLTFVWVIGCIIVAVIGLIISEAIGTAIVACIVVKYYVRSNADRWEDLMGWIHKAEDYTYSLDYNYNYDNQDDSSAANRNYNVFKCSKKQDMAMRIACINMVFVNERKFDSLGCMQYGYDHPPAPKNFDSFEKWLSQQSSNGFIDIKLSDIITFLYGTGVLKQMIKLVIKLLRDPYKHDIQFDESNLATMYANIVIFFMLPVYVLSRIFAIIIFPMIITVYLVVYSLWQDIEVHQLVVLIVYMIVMFLWLMVSVRVFYKFYIENHILPFVRYLPHPEGKSYGMAGTSPSKQQYFLFDHVAGYIKNYVYFQIKRGPVERFIIKHYLGDDIGTIVVQYIGERFEYKNIDSLHKWAGYNNSIDNLT